MAKKETAVAVAKITAAGVVLAAIIAAIPALVAALNKPKEENKGIVPKVSDVKVVQKLEDETSALDVETLRDISMWDLRGWKPVPPDEKEQRISPANYVNYLHVRKLKPVGIYRAHYSTSGVAIDLRCITQRATVLLQSGAPDHPGEGKKEYEIDVDISQVPVNHEFLIVIEATYWNGFQNQQHEELSTYTDKDMNYMDELAVFVLLPENKPLRNVQRWERVTDSPDRVPYEGDERLHQDTEGRFVYWSIGDRKPNHHYQLTWDW